MAKGTRAFLLFSRLVPIWIPLWVWSYVSRVQEVIALQAEVMENQKCIDELHERDRALAVVVAKLRRENDTVVGI